MKSVPAPNPCLTRRPPRRTFSSQHRTAAMNATPSDRQCDREPAASGTPQVEVSESCVAPSLASRHPPIHPESPTPSTTPPGADLGTRFGPFLPIRSMAAERLHLSAIPAVRPPIHRSAMNRCASKSANPEGCQMVAGGRRTASTPGSGWVGHRIPEGCQKPATPGGSTGDGGPKSGGIAALNPRLPAGKPPACAGVWTFSAGLTTRDGVDPGASGSDPRPGPHALGR